MVLRRSLGVDVLAFEHPSGGRQLVKGTIEPGEAPEEAAVRELFEERAWSRSPSEISERGRRVSKSKSGRFIFVSLPANCRSAGSTIQKTMAAKTSTSSGIRCWRRPRKAGMKSMFALLRTFAA